MNELNRKKAIEWIPLVVDGEISPENQRTFFSYLRTDEVVRKEYESHRRLKEALSRRSRRTAAPDHLRNKIEDLLQKEWERVRQSDQGYST
jgi:ferric-dicitrate binding protein FerR (iron transport regulator)